MVGFADETVVGEGYSVGARLRGAREAHGLSLDDIAARTRVPTRHLKAIEEDAYDQLPAAPYSVGFAKAFADAVGLNREEIGREFRAEKEGYGAADVGSSYVSEDPSSSSNGGLIRIGVILVIIVAIAIGLWKAGIFGGSSQVVPPPVAPATAPEAPAPAAPPVGETPSATAPEAKSAQPEEESSSRTKSSSDEEASKAKSSSDDNADKGEKRRKGTNEEGRKGEPSGSTSSTSTGSSPSRESERPAVPTTRDLNLNAQKGAAPAAAPAPSAAPPVIAPPPPPPAATPAAPSATP